VSTNSFADLGASRPVVDALTEGGITVPFPVQRMVLPVRIEPEAGHRTGMHTLAGR
jgi:superfamily II DNA/RNA helicase